MINKFIKIHDKNQNKKKTPHKKKKKKNQRYIDITFTHPIHRLFSCLALSSGLTHGYSQTLCTCWGTSSYSVSVLGVLRLCYEYSYNDSGALVGTFIPVYNKIRVNRRGAAK